jgi:hypothetical protein
LTSRCKLRILRFRASTKAHSLRCISSPNQTCSKFNSVWSKPCLVLVRIMQASEIFRLIHCCVTLFLKAPQKIFYLLCCLLFTSGISSIIVQFSRCNFSGLF